MKTPLGPSRARANLPVFTVEETRISAWYLTLFVPMLASLTLFVLFTPPIPIWIRVAGHAAWAIPAVIFVTGGMRLFFKQLTTASRQSVVRNFNPVTTSEHQQVQEWISLWIQRINREPIRLTKAHHGLHHDQSCVYGTAIIGRGPYQYPCFIAMVHTIRAPNSVWFARRAVRWNPSIARPRYKLGPPTFQRRWDIAGNRETAEFLFTEQVSNALQTLIPDRAQVWSWQDDRLAVLLRGKPTAHGINTTLDAVVSVAEAASIQPPRSAGAAMPAT